MRREIKLYNDTSVTLAPAGEFEAKGFIEACLQGGLKYNFTDENFKGSLYIPPVILGAQIKVKSKGVLKFDLVDWKGSVEISDKIPLID